MYEHARNQLSTALLHQFKPCQVSTILGIVDTWISNYDLTSKSTDIQPYTNVVPQAVELYVASKAVEGQSDLSNRNRCYLLTQFFQIIRKPLDEIKTNDIRLFMYTYQKQRNISDRTMDRYRSILSSFFSFCVDEEYIVASPMKNIKPIRFEAKERESLTQYELEELRHSCMTKRETAVLEMFYSTGCRCSELISLKKEDINFSDYTVHLFGKGKKHRTSYLNAKALIAIKEYLESRTDGSPYLFVASRMPFNKMTISQVENLIHKIASRTTIKKPVTPHIIRHTTATTALDAGMKIEDIQQLLGHSCVGTTLIYAKVNHEHVKSEHKRCVV